MRPYSYYHGRNDDRDRTCERNSRRLDRLQPVVLQWPIERAGNPELLRKDLEKLAEVTADAMVKLERAQRRVMNALEQWRRHYDDRLVSRSGYYTHRIRFLDQLQTIQSELQEKRRAPGSRASR